MFLWVYRRLNGLIYVLLLIDKDIKYRCKIQILGFHVYINCFRNLQENKMVTLRNSAIPATINHEPLPIRQTQCPRCNNRLQQDFPDMEPECVACGYVDYTFIPKVSVGKSILQTATEYFIRYNGTYDYLKDTTVHVKTIRIGNPNGSGRLENRPTCPFCEESMQSLSLSGKRKNKVETRFKCVSDHRISLFMGSTRSEMGWR